MLTLSDKKQNKLIYIVTLMYTSVYLAKLNYGALAVEIIKEFGCTRSAAGMVGSFFFFSYGVGQVVNGFLAKHMNEKLFMTAALFGSALCNVAMCFAPSVEVMKYIWLVNGIVMSPLWCNVVKVQGKYISDKNALLEALAHDKKGASGGKISAVILKDIGNFEFVKLTPEELIERLG